MNPNLIKQVTEEFAAIDWFSKVGEPAEEASTDFRVIADEREAKRMQKSKQSEYVTQEAQAWLTMTLSRNFREQGNDWNKVVGKARNLYEKKVEPLLDEFQKRHGGWGPYLKSAVLWDVMAAFAERYYTLACPLEPMWFGRELVIYRNGRLFCGFEYEGDIMKAFQGRSGTLLCY